MHRRWPCPVTTPRPRCFSSAAMMRPASAISRLASEPALSCVPRLTMPWVTRRWPRETFLGRFAHTTSALPRPREERPSTRSAATPRSTARSRSHSRNHSPFPKTTARTTGPSHRTRTGGKARAGKAMATVSRRRVSPRATLEAAARARRPREIATDRPAGRRRMGGAGGGRTGPSGSERRHAR